MTTRGKTTAVASAEGDDPRQAKVRTEYERLLANADTKAKGNLGRLRAALESMRQRKQTDFSYAAAARAVADLGYKGPAYSSIKNDPHRRFQPLVDVYDEAYGVRRAQRAGGEDDDLVSLIADPKIRARVGMLIAMNRALQDRNTWLHDQYRRLTLPSPSSQPTLPAGGGVSEATNFTPDERDAARRFLRGLERQGWQIEEATGAIKDHQDNTVAPPYFVDALRKITG